MMMKASPTVCVLLMIASIPMTHWITTMATVSAVNCHATFNCQSIMKKIDKQKVLFMIAAPTSVDKEVVMAFCVFLMAYVYAASNSLAFEANGAKTNEM